MATFDTMGGVLGATGRHKLIVPAGSGGQIVRPSFTEGALPSDGTINAAGLLTATPGRVARVVIVATGAGAVSLYDCNAPAGAVLANEIFTMIAPVVGTTYSLDIPVVNGLWVTTGAGVQVVVTFT